MTNFEKWSLYTRNLPSPQSFLDFGFYWLISTCLQRRVWYYEGEGSLYPNLYGVLVGPPAVGKGLVLGRVSEMLRFHKYEKGAMIKTNTGNELPPLFPVGADSVTFEELLSDVAGNCRRIPTINNTVYTHTSYAFVLEELSSLFKRKTEDVVKFLLNAYDCKGYEYKTKHQGKDLIRKLCLSFFAGTQVDFLRGAHNQGIFGEGFSSRTIFLFESDPRFEAFHISQMDEDQKRARTELLDWIKRLAGLYGQITYDQETYNWLERWHVSHASKRKLASLRMQQYFGRKKVNLLKLAAAVHFAENLTYTIPLSAFKRALDFLERIEPNMDAGLSISGRNELHSFGRRILNYLKARPSGVSKNELILQFGVDMSVDEIEACIKELELGYGVKSMIVNGKCNYVG